MRFVKTLLSAAALFAGLGAAQDALGFTSVPTSARAGQPATIRYTSSRLSSPVTIVLRKGDPNDLQVIQTLTTSATGGNYTWIPLPSFANGNDYALQIQQGNEINYSGAITLSGADPAAVSSAQAVSASLSSVGAALTSSYAQQASISSIQSIIASYNSSLQNLTAPQTASMTAASSAGTGTALPRNTTMSSATLSNTAGTTGATRTGGAAMTGSGTTSSPAQTSTGAAAKMASAISGASPLALVLCIMAGIFI